VFGYKAYLLIPLTVMAFVFIACGTAPAAAVAPQIIEVERIVEKAVLVETVREVVKEVPVEKVVEVEKIIEVVRDRDPGSLVIYSGRSESLVGPIIEQFEEVTGINVAVKYGSTGEIAATILEEGQNSPADVFFAQDPGGLGEVANAGMFETLPTGITEKVPTWARSPESQWVGISGRGRVVVYNTDNLTEDQIPTSMEDFTKPDWKGRIGWAPTNGSFQAMVTAMRVVWGEDKTREWLLGIQANEPKVYPKNTPTVAAAAAGEVDVGFVNHYYLHRFLAEQGEDFPARNYHVTGGGPGGIVLVAGGGILKTAENKDNAERFFNFMLSRVVQQYFSGQTYEYPLVDGVKTNRILTPLEEINNPDIDMASLDDLAGTQTLLRDLGILQ
jgi:iron(III) transport system substrate-binding protein